MSITSLKTLLRKRFLALRNSLDKGYTESASIKIIQNFEKFLYDTKFSKQSVIGAYLPIGSELDPLPILHRLLQKGYLCALPKLTEDLTNLEFRKWEPQVKLALNSFFNVLEPVDSALLEPNIIIAPLLTCDRNGNRLGYGKGYYDRYIAMHKKGNAKLTIIALCYEQQMSAEILPHESHDQPLNIIITELNTYRIGG